jgi:hypothetical protein
VVQRRRGLGALACRLTAWAQSARQPPACWSRLPAGRTGQYKGDFVPATSTVCVGVQAAARMELSVQGRYRTMSGLGCLGRQIGQKSFFLQKR